MNERWVTVTKTGETHLVRLAGEIDLANASDIGRDIVLRCQGATAVVLDLTEVAFLDSAGVRLLDTLVGDLDDLETPVRLVVGDRGPARMTLKLCAFREDLLVADLEQALREVGG